MPPPSFFEHRSPSISRNSDEQIPLINHGYIPMSPPISFPFFSRSHKSNTDSLIARSRILVNHWADTHPGPITLINVFQKQVNWHPARSIYIWHTKNPTIPGRFLVSATTSAPNVLPSSSPSDHSFQAVLYNSVLFYL